MIEDKFHYNRDAERRGANLPARLRESARRGVTLVELMVSTLLLMFVCIGWLKIIGIQSARKEARRREAVERLAGMIDSFLHVNREKNSISEKSYVVTVSTNAGLVSFNAARDANQVYPMFDGEISPIGYRLVVVKKSMLANNSLFENWGSCTWLVGELYNRSDCSVADAGKPFFTLPVCLGL